jgi:hypothetical protein
MAFRVSALKAFDCPLHLQGVPPLAHAAVLLVARTLLVSFGLPCPSVLAILSETGASRSRAYELAATLTALLPTLIQPRGRPSVPAAASVRGDDDAALTREILRYVMRHPGCVDCGRERQRYSDGFRRFVLELRERHAEMAVESFALATEVPLGTVKDWLRAPTLAAAADDQALDPPAGAAAAEGTDLDGLHVQTVLEAWRRWEGSFVDFCQHVRHNLLVPFGLHLVRRILNVHAERTIVRRNGRGPDELALRGAFQTFFAGAQWVGDGMQVPVVIDEQRFVFNLELDVDAHTAALVGASVRDEEDSAAVIDAFDGGVITTGAPPLALLLDNRPSNHTPQVDAALGDTLRIRATLARPQNKAHVEGAFGLFSQILPMLTLDTHSDPRHIARALLSLVAEVWARTTNHRPRRARKGNSRVDLYTLAPTTEQIDEARQALRQTLERQMQARRTLEARRRPDILALLDHAFAELQLLDPERHVRLAIAGYPRDPIVNGIAIFRGKKRSNTLPDGVDARYLLGIVKNVTAKTEGECLAEELFDQRTQMRDRILAPLIAERDALLAQGDVSTTIATCVDNALAIPTSLERRFWLDTLAAAIAAQLEPARRELFLSAARRIEATFSLTPDQRHDTVRYVADRVIPLR